MSCTRFCKNSVEGSRREPCLLDVCDAWLFTKKKSALQGTVHIFCTAEELHFAVQKLKGVHIGVNVARLDVVENLNNYREMELADQVAVRKFRNRMPTDEILINGGGEGSGAAVEELHCLAEELPDLAEKWKQMTDADVVLKELAMCEKETDEYNIEDVNAPLASKAHTIPSQVPSILKEGRRRMEVDTNLQCVKVSEDDHFISLETGSIRRRRARRTFWLVYWKDHLKECRDSSGFLIHYSMTILAGMIAGIASYADQYIGPLPQSTQDCCCIPSLGTICHLPLVDPLVLQGFLLVLGSSLPAVTSSSKTFGGKEWVTYSHNHVTANSGWDIVSFWSAKVFKDLFPRIVVSPFVFLSMYFCLALTTGRPFVLYLICLLVHLNSYAIGYIISVIKPDCNIPFIGVVVIFMLGVLSGISPSLSWVAENFPILYGLWYVSFFRWLVEAYYNEELTYFSDTFDVEAGKKFLGYEDSLEVSLLMATLTWAVSLFFSFLIIVFGRRAASSINRGYTRCCKI